MTAATLAIEPAVFDVRQLSKVYRMGDVEVQGLRDVTLRLPEGE